MRLAVMKRRGQCCGRTTSCFHVCWQQVKEERNLMQQQRDDQQERASLGGGQAAPRSGSSGFSFRSAACNFRADEPAR